MFEPLLVEFEKLRKRTARFRRVAVHIHSPDSEDWASVEEADKTRNSRLRFTGESGLGVYAGELRDHLDLACITDHMRCTFATSVAAHEGRPDEFMVLPGMEVNFCLPAPMEFARIHLLAILPSTATPENFACLFNGQSIPKSDVDRTMKHEVKDLHLGEFVNCIHGEGGICIAAHVENSQGIRLRFRQTARNVIRMFRNGNARDLENEFDVPAGFKEYIFASRVDAIEIHRTDHVNNLSLDFGFWRTTKVCCHSLDF